MKLIEFAYKDDFWTLNPVQLNPLTLLVGENAVGKSRTLGALWECMCFISEGRVNASNIHSNGSYACKLVWQENESIYRYRYACARNTIVNETLTVFSKDREDLVISRDSKSCLLKGAAVAPPADKLVIQVRRDKTDYPLFEKLIQWADNVVCVPFAVIDMADRPNLADWVAGFSDEQKRSVAERVRQAGYEITAIDAKSFAGRNLLCIQEAGAKREFLAGDLSNGMSRTVSLSVLLEYMAQNMESPMLLIDDFCEGLDYSRSVKLGKLVMDFCVQHNIAMVASSNDNFLMDVVPIEDWVILGRQGSEVKGISQRTHPQVFDDFAFTGLNNFSLLSSNFLSQYSA